MAWSSRSSCWPSLLSAVLSMLQNATLVNASCLFLSLPPPLTTQTLRVRAQILSVNSGVPDLYTHALAVISNKAWNYYVSLPKTKTKTKMKTKGPQNNVRVFFYFSFLSVFEFEHDLESTRVRLNGQWRRVERLIDGQLNLSRCAVPNEIGLSSACVSSVFLYVLFISRFYCMRARVREWNIIIQAVFVA